MKRAEQHARRERHRELILTTIAGGLSHPSMIADEVRIPKWTVSEILCDLVTENKLLHPRRGVYMLAVAPKLKTPPKLVTWLGVVFNWFK